MDLVFHRKLRRSCCGFEDNPNGSGWNINNPERIKMSWLRTNPGLTKRKRLDLIWVNFSRMLQLLSSCCRDGTYKRNFAKAFTDTADVCAYSQTIKHFQMKLLASTFLLHGRHHYHQNVNIWLLPTFITEIEECLLTFENCESN